MWNLGNEGISTADPGVFILSLPLLGWPGLFLETSVSNTRACCASFSASFCSKTECSAELPPTAAMCKLYFNLTLHYNYVRGVIYLGRRGRPGTNQQPDLRRATPHLLVTDIVVVSRVVRGACNINKVDFALVSIFWPAIIFCNINKVDFVLVSIFWPAITFCRFGIDWHPSLIVNIRSFQSIFNSMIEATLSPLQILDSITLFNQSVITMFVCHLIA